MLKLIPSEQASRKNKFRRQSGGKKSRSAPPNPGNQQQHFFEVKDQNGKLKKVCIQMIKYVKGDKHSTQEIGDMIHGLQESILCLEKQKNKILWSKKKK